MKVALIESEIAWQNEAANRSAMRGVLENVDADVAVFPEQVFSGFTPDPRPDPDAEPFLTALAAERETALIAGHVGAGPQNVALAVDARGAVLARYAKLHPFSLTGEDRQTVPGSELPVFLFGGFQAAVLICYDLRFPEAFREATLKGAQLFFVIANWPASRVAHWRALLIARAIENQAFVVGVNRIGSDPHVEYKSSSLAVGPSGDVLHEGPGAIEIDVEEVERVRAEFPFLKDIRTDRYRLG